MTNVNFLEKKKFPDIGCMIREFNSIPKRRNKKTVKQKREMLIKIGKISSPIFKEKYSTEYIIYF